MPDSTVDHQATPRRSWPDRVRDSVFPAATPRPVTRRRVALGIAAVVAGVVVSLLRNRGAGAFNSIWAEDGSEFLNDALNLPTSQTLFKGLNGYFVLLPRLLAEPASVLPLGWAAAVLSTGAAVATTLFALAVFAASGAHFRSPLLRLLVSVPVIVTPVGAHSTPNNVATLQFAALYATFWMLLWVPATRLGRAAALTVIVLTGLSTILVAIFIPLALLRWYARRDRWSTGLVAATVGVSATQIIALSTGVVSRGNISHPRFDPIWAFVEYLVWGLPYSVLGQQWLEPAASYFNGIFSPQPGPHIVEHVALIGVAYLILLTAVIVAVVRFSRPAWGLAAVAAVHAVVILALELMAMGYHSRTYLVQEIFLIGTERYLVPSGLLMITVLVALLRPGPAPAADTVTATGLAGLRARLALAPNAWPVVAYATLLLVICAANLRVDNPRVWTRPWSDAVAEARAECAARPGASVVPGRFGGSAWYPWVNVPCRKLRG